MLSVGYKGALLYGMGVEIGTPTRKQVGITFVKLNMCAPSNSAPG